MWMDNPESVPELQDHEKREWQYYLETGKFGMQYGVPRDDYKIWINKNYPDLAHKYPLIEESVSFRGKIFKVKDGGLRLVNLGIEDLDEIKGINYLKELYFLDLSKNRITEIKNLTNLNKLIILNLSDNEIQEIKGLDNQKNLKILYLDKNQIKEIKSLDNLTLLVDLNLDENQIKEIKNLEKLKNLNYLFINKNKIKTINGLSELTNLNRLEINYNEISSVKNRSVFPSSLRFLDIYHNPIPKEEYKEIIKFYNIP
jgi:Leucine-rich repeat (LRR) protein